MTKGRRSVFSFFLVLLIALTAIGSTTASAAGRCSDMMGGKAMLGSSMSGSTMECEKGSPSARDCTDAAGGILAAAKLIEPLHYLPTHFWSPSVFAASAGPSVISADTRPDHSPPRTLA